MKKFLILLFSALIAFAAYEANADKMITKKAKPQKSTSATTSKPSVTKKSSAATNKRASNSTTTKKKKKTTTTTSPSKRTNSGSSSSYAGNYYDAPADSVAVADDTPYEFLIERVNLGLPSGTIWSDRNVAGDNWLDYGLLFAFGCTEVLDSYPEDVSDDLYDSQNIAGTERDVAYLLYDFDWQQPNVAQWKELCDYCTVEAYSDGLLFTGPNGTQLAIPYTPGYESDMAAVLWTAEKGVVVYIDGSGDTVTYQILRDIPAHYGLPLRAVAIR